MLTFFSLPQTFCCALYCKPTVIVQSITVLHSEESNIIQIDFLFFNLMIKAMHN